MATFDIDAYVDSLILNHNNTLDNNQKNLYSKADYYEMVLNVLKVYQTHHDYSIEELRKILYDSSHIEQTIYDFIYKRQVTPGVSFSYGSKYYQEMIIAGNSQEVVMDNDSIIDEPILMDENTIFDLASVTKLFTSISILKLVSLGLISLEDAITRYAPEFKNLNQVTIYDLLSFNVSLQTDKRIDLVSFNEAEEILFNIKVVDNVDKSRVYTDMGAMILKYVIECVTSMKYYDFLESEFLSKADMHNTFVNVPMPKINQVASTNYDSKVYADGSFMTNTHNFPGVPYDQKAQVMGAEDGNLSGHAGLFSSTPDMISLLRNLPSILPMTQIEQLSQNRTGKIINGKFSQHYGYLVYSKNPNSQDSEVSHVLSGKAFASAGWTGNQLTYDPLNEIYFFLGTNRPHNRVTYIAPTQKEKIFYDENGRKLITLPNCITKIDSSNFAYERDVIVQTAIKLAMQYKILDDILQTKTYANNAIEIRKKKHI